MLRRSGPGALAGAAEAKGNITAPRGIPSGGRMRGAAEPFAWGDKPPPPRLMSLCKWRPVPKGALIGFSD
jgi:hypothetical protein